MFRYRGLIDQVGKDHHWGGNTYHLDLSAQLPRVVSYLKCMISGLVAPGRLETSCLLSAPMDQPTPWLFRRTNSGPQICLKSTEES